MAAISAPAKFPWTHAAKMSAQSLEIFARILTAIGWVFLPLALLPLAQLLLPKSIFISSLTRNLVTIIDGVSNGLGEAVKWALPCW